MRRQYQHPLPRSLLERPAAARLAMDDSTARYFCGTSTASTTYTLVVSNSRDPDSISSTSTGTGDGNVVQG